MKVYGLYIPDERGLTNAELYAYVRELKIKTFRGVFMRDTLPSKVNVGNECGIVNFNLSVQPGSHWVCYFKNGDNNQQRIYFDSFGQVTLDEVQKYLKTREEYEMGAPVIQRNTDIVQRTNTHVCGHLCLLVLTLLTRKHLSFASVLDQLRDGFAQGDW